MISRTLQNKLKYEGAHYTTNNYGDLIVVEYKRRDVVLVEFVDTGYRTITRIGEIEGGKVRDRSLPTLCGVGIIGDAPAYHEGKLSKAYVTWSNMLCRCYSENIRDSTPTYNGCTTSDNFKHYSYFKTWYESQIGSDNDWFLDKDIIKKGNKVYSEDNCVLVPREINNLFTKRHNHRGKYPIGVTVDKRGGKYFAQLSRDGSRTKFGYSNTPEEAFYAYKKAKEAYIKELANKWKDQIDPRVYEALMNYQVEITD